MPRKSEITRKTSETDIKIKLVLDSSEKSAIGSGVPFFDHMLDAMSRHGHFFVDLKCRGDTGLDDHHSVEDVGICLGRAFKKALGDKAGIRRFGHAVVPMDDALSLTAVDLSGRSYFKYSGMDLYGTINQYDEELTVEFLKSFASNAEMNLHVMVLCGENRHHIHESIFKSLAAALYMAASVIPEYENEVPSTKGSVE